MPALVKTIKLALLGNAGVGKTSIMIQVRQYPFNSPN